jgi:hypothetical protein
MKTLTIILIICALGSIHLFGQETDSLRDSVGEIEVDSTREFLLTAIENTDIGFLWSGSQSQDNRLGFIGDDYQRLQIRFMSVIQNFDNPYEYFLYGKSRVEENICEFQGSLIIRETGVIEDEEFTNVTRAYLAGDYVLFEDQSCLHSGIFRGNFITTVYLDDEGTVYYDNLEKDERDYTNNEFFGQWEGYYPYEVMDANWGDYRIPYSTQLDMGLDAFKPSFNFLDQGWQEYLDEQERIEEGGEVEEWWGEL